MPHSMLRTEKGMPVVLLLSALLVAGYMRLS